MIIASNPVWSLTPNAWGDVCRMITEIRIDARANEPKLPLQMVGRSAVISITGPMVDGPSWLANYGYAVTGDIRRALQVAASDAQVRDAVLLIKSPGGSVSGLSAATDAATALALAKPLHTAVDGLMASAALMIGVQAQTVSAGRGDMVGSIGTYAVLYDTSKLYESVGVKPVLISSGGLKGAITDGLPITDEAIADMQRIVDAYTIEFKQAVMSGRRMSASKVDALATGQVWIGGEAKDRGLIDSVDYADHAISALQKQRQSTATARNAARIALV